MMRGVALVTGLVALSSAPTVTAQNARTPHRASTMTAIAQAESQGAARVQGAVRLRVPVKLTKMMPDAERVSVHCVVSGDSGSGASRSAIFAIANGEFDKVIELTVAPNAGESLIEAKSYVCRLELHKHGSMIGNPSQGAPPSNQLYKLARPDAYFKAVVAGSLGGGTVNDGIVGSGDLTAPPKRRQ